MSFNLILSEHSMETTMRRTATSAFVCDLPISLFLSFFSVCLSLIIFLLFSCSLPFFLPLFLYLLSLFFFLHSLSLLFSLYLSPQSICQSINQPSVSFTLLIPKKKKKKKKKGRKTLGDSKSKKSSELSAFLQPSRSGPRVRVAIVGGGFGGSLCIKHLDKASDVDIVLIEPKERFWYALGGPRCLVDRDFWERCSIPYTKFVWLAFLYLSVSLALSIYLLIGSLHLFAYWHC